MTARTLSLLVLASTFAASTSTVAVVPGARTMLRRFAERQALDRVSASPLLGRVTTPSHPAPIPARIELTLPSGCKLQSEFPEGKATLTYSGGKVTDQGSQSAPLEAFMAFACPLEAMKNVPAGDAESSLDKLATAWGVNLGVSSLGMIDGHAANVVGARPRELDKPQIWIDRSSDRIVRVIGSYGGKLWDLRFEQPASIATNRLASRVTRVWQDKGEVLTLHLLAAEPKVSGPAAAQTEPADEEE